MRDEVSGTTRPSGVSGPTRASGVSGPSRPSFFRRVLSRLLGWALDLIYLVFILVLLPVDLLRGRLPKRLDHWKRRALTAPPRRAGRGPALWVHGVSVGEVLAVRELLRELTARRPELEIIVSSTTKLGYEAALRTYPEATVIPFPLDLSFLVERAFRRLRPDLLALVEHDLWPNCLAAARRGAVPVALLNARRDPPAEDTTPRRALIRWPPADLALLTVQDAGSAAAYRALGFPAERVVTTGNLKFDNPTPPPAPDLRSSLGYSEDDWIFVAASTHEGEEEAALASLRALGEFEPQAKLVIAPRRIERSQAVAELIEAAGFGLARYSAQPREARDVLLVDTLGDLARLQGLADLVFVGGSLAPIGGHSVIEPASLGRAILIGPEHFNAKSVVRDFLREDALEVVEDEARLVGRVVELRRDASRCRELGERARRAVEASLGASARTAESLESLLPPRPRD